MAINRFGPTDYPERKGRQQRRNGPTVRRFDHRVLMDVADDAEGVGGEVLAKRDVVDGSPPLKAQARGGDQQVRPEGPWTGDGLRGGEVALHCVARSAG